MSAPNERISGVLLVGFGGPESIDAVRPFMCELMGREPSDDVVDEACMHYLAIGGKSPLPEIADAIATALGEKLSRRSAARIPVAVGMRYTEPRIGDAVRRLVDDGASRIVMVSLSPFESKITHGAYREAIAEALDDHPGVEVVEAPPIGLLESFAEYAAASTMSSLENLEPATGSLVVFSAHSLPLSDLTKDDPYVDGLRTVIDRICEYLDYEAGHEGEGGPALAGIRTYGNLRGATQPWVLAYQSKGKRPGEWLGPSLDDVITAAHASGTRSIVVVPIGFATDHLETLYDLDIVAADQVLSLGMEFERGPVPNEHDHFITGLADAVAPLI